MAGIAWTDSDVKWAVDVLGFNVSVGEACRYMTTEMGRNVDSTTLSRVFRRRGMGDPVEHLKPNTMRREAPPGTRDEVSVPAFRAEPPELVVDPEFRDMIPPPTAEERASLESALVAAGGASMPLDVWSENGFLTLIDGHNRYEICRRLGLSYTARTHSFADRESAKAWIFENQIARRNLSPDQVLMLAAMRGVTTTRDTDRRREMASVLAAAGKGGLVLSGRLALALAYGAHVHGQAKLRPYAPRVLRGPSVAPHVPDGHELAGLSTLTGPDGEKKGEWAKTRVAGADEPPTPVPSAHLVKRTATLQRGDGTTVAQWVTTAADEKAREDLMREAWAAHAKNYSGLAGIAPAPGHSDSDLLTIYPLGDPHVGLLSWSPETGDSFDIGIACRELLACVTALVEAAPPSEHAIVCNLGDFLHAQDDSALTPGHGNRLDVDGRFAKVLEAGHTVLRGIVDAALRKHKRVTVRNLPGNHDPRVAAELSMWLRAIYEREPRVIVADAYAAHQYDAFGSVLIGWHHGDRTPGAELPAIMATDRAEDWGRSTTRVWHCGHVHHLSRKESPGCVVETHRTLAARDAWHAGRYRSGRSLQAITYHREYGETARATVGLARVRAALDEAS